MANVPGELLKRFESALAPYLSRVSTVRVRAGYETFNLDPISWSSDAAQLVVAPEAQVRIEGLDSKGKYLVGRSLGVSRRTRRVEEETEEQVQYQEQPSDPETTLVPVAALAAVLKANAELSRVIVENSRATMQFAGKVYADGLQILHAQIARVDSAHILETAAQIEAASMAVALSLTDSPNDPRYEMAEKGIQAFKDVLIAKITAGASKPPEKAEKKEPPPPMPEGLKGAPK